jgi:hypothetical protein
MFGDNAIYLAKQIDSWGLINMTEKEQLNTIKNNEVTVKAFDYAIGDLSNIMRHFLSGDRNSNLYGYKMKFFAIEEIASTLACSLINDSLVRWFGIGSKNFGRIADDLSEMVEILEFEVYHNMNVLHPRDKEYKVMASSSMVERSAVNGLVVGSNPT